MPYTSWERENATTGTSVFSDTDIATLANNVGVLSAEIDNSSGAWTHADFELLCDFGTNPTGPVELLAITALDGTNYVDSSLTATSYGSPGTRLGGFGTRVTTSAQKSVMLNVPIPSSKFKLQLINKGGFAFDGSGKYLTMWRKRMKLNP